MTAFMDAIAGGGGIIALLAAGSQRKQHRTSKHDRKQFLHFSFLLGSLYKSKDGIFPVFFILHKQFSIIFPQNKSLFASLLFK